MNARAPRREKFIVADSMSCAMGTLLCAALPASSPYLQQQRQQQQQQVR
jgi:hypothetical protein